MYVYSVCVRSVGVCVCTVEVCARLAVWVCDVVSKIEGKCTLRHKPTFFFFPAPSTLANNEPTALRPEDLKLEAKKVPLLHGSGGFFLACQDFGENVRPFISRLSCFVCLFVCFACLFGVEISSRTLIPLFMPGSVSPQWLSELRRLGPNVP